MATKGFTTGQPQVQLGGMDQYKKAAIEELARQQQAIYGANNVSRHTTEDEAKGIDAQAAAIDFKLAQQTALKNMMGSSLNPGEYMAALQQMGNYGEQQRDDYATQAIDNRNRHVQNYQNWKEAEDNLSGSSFNKLQRSRDRTRDDRIVENRRKKESIDALNSQGIIPQAEQKTTGHIIAHGAPQLEKKKVKSIADNNQFNTIGVGIDTGSN